VRSASLNLFPLLPATLSLSRYGQALSQSPAASWDALAHAVAASPEWPTGSLLVLRFGAHPLLAAAGYFDNRDLMWLQGQIHTLQSACQHLRYVSYRRAEEDCAQLAIELWAALGPARLSAARFTAIPRGGLVVLGLLAVLLGLDRDQIGPPFPPDRPLVVVDDCAVSGARSFHFLRETDHPEIIFAHLYSHPELRTAITSRETRVAACFSARDLDGQPSETTAHILDERYWSGEVEALCFPWNEPDRTFWNPVAKRWDLAWRIVPPELCLKNRPAPGKQPIPIQVQPEGVGPLLPSERALFAEIDGGITLFDLVTGQGFSLEGIGSDLWRAIVRLGDLEAAVAELSREYDAPEETVRADAHRFTDDLLARGLLEMSATPALAS
jgi:hypothetical protein